MIPELDRLLRQGGGEWLRGEGPEADIVISCRARLARNLADRRFVLRTDEAERRAIVNDLRIALHGAPGLDDAVFVDLPEVEDLDRQFLVERHLISRELAGAETERGVLFARGETVSVMANEEDHLRMQVLRSGLRLDQARDDLFALEEHLEQQVEFAFHPRYGFLTACPTNCGTGLRFSVMMHLPALRMSQELEKVFNAMRRVSVVVRGLFGEGSEAAGDFFQFSNQVTLGKSEDEILGDIAGLVPAIIGYERTLRERLLEESGSELRERVEEAFSRLAGTEEITSAETLQLLSDVRLGVNLELIDGVPIETVNELFLLTQPAHLQAREGRALGTSDRDRVRADYLQSRLRGD